MAQESDAAKANLILIPKTEKDITKEWISKVTKENPVDNSIVITTNIQDGVGFLSNMCRISFQTETGKTESIILKLLPDNPQYREYTLDQKFDKREIQFYSFVYPEVLEIAPELKDNMCKHYYSRYTDETEEGGYASMLVIEDLKPLGYDMLNTESSNWRKNMEEVMKFCAKFHAASAALEKIKNVDILEKFPFCMGKAEIENTGVLLAVGMENLTRVDATIAKYSGSPEMQQIYKEVSKNLETLFVKTLKKGLDFPCLIHGDIWGPNVLVDQRDTNSPIKVIDWQILAYRDATYELSTAILSCLPKNEITRSNINMLLKIYFKEFIDACKRHGFEYTARSEEDFLKFHDTWGMAFGYYWFVLSAESFEKDQQEKMFKVFEVIHKEYKIPEFLLNELSSSS